jgi:uncharacterized OsmC-like protein
MLEYQIEAHSEAGGRARAEANGAVILFDASSGRKEGLPNPAELLLTALAACILKNVERYSGILKLEYRKARIKVYGERNNTPPYMKKIHYRLYIDSDVSERQLELWHKNIRKFGTISNTIARAAELTGEIHKMNEE